MQASVGNQAVVRGLQAKLAIGASGDRYEQEADAVAARVMRMTAPVPIDLSPTTASSGSVQRACAKCNEDATLQRTESAAAPTTAPPIVDTVLSSPGQRLDAAAHDFMAPRFGRNFDPIRIHTDPIAARSAAAVGARAYTVGEHIVFGQGEYAPASERGRHLIAHELAHAVQQQHGLYRKLQRQEANAPVTNPVTGPPSPATGRIVYFCSKPIMLAAIHGKRHAFFRLGGTGAGTDSYGLQHAKSCPCAWQGWPRFNDPSDRDADNADCVPTAIPEARLLAEWNTYPIGQYCAWGPNSNTYARNIAERLGHYSPLPPGSLPGYYDAPPSAGSSGPNPYMTALAPFSCFDSMCDGCPTD